MREQHKNIGNNISVWIDHDDTPSVVCIRLDNLPVMTVEQAVVLNIDLSKAIDISLEFRREIAREKTKNISIEYLVEKGWTVKDINTLQVESPNHWIAVSPLITIEEKYRIYTLPDIYAGVSPLEAYKNICLWASDTGVDL